MNFEKRSQIVAIILSIIAVGIILVVGSGQATSDSRSRLYASNGTAPEITQPPRETLYKNVKIFDNIAFNISDRYMEAVDPKVLIFAGIRGMLETLDPFSVLMERKPYEKLMELTHGKYEGLGMQIEQRDNRIIIVTPIEGTPAYRMGFQAGDIIWEIDDRSTEGMSSEEASRLMRGQAGTTVRLKIMREGFKAPEEYTVERAVITLKSVNYYGVMDNGVGYLRLSRFSDDTHRELQNAIADLNTRKVNGLILDLRSNGGGLLDEAVQTASLFLDRDRLVVYTMGQKPELEKRYTVRTEPLYKDGPLVILVDDATASASEIVAGAIQDWDRGVIIGDTTYGKGLVQQVIPVENSNDVFLKLTTAKYYIPSGRSIQKKDWPRPHSETELIYEEESDRTVTEQSIRDKTRTEVFRTDRGRVVYGGGGIVPDITLERERYKPIEWNLERQRLFFSFAVLYTAKHPNLPQNFEVDDQVLAEFNAYLKEKKFDYKTPTEIELDSLVSLINQEQKQDIYAGALNNLRQQVALDKQQDFERSIGYFKRALKREILLKQYGEKALYEELVLKSDPFIKKAVDLLSNKKEYSALLRPGSKSANN